MLLKSCKILKVKKCLLPICRTLCHKGFPKDWQCLVFKKNSHRVLHQILGRALKKLFITLYESLLMVFPWNVVICLISGSFPFSDYTNWVWGGLCVYLIFVNCGRFYILFGGEGRWKRDVSVVASCDDRLCWRKFCSIFYRWLDFGFSWSCWSSPSERETLGNILLGGA